ncbi:MAG: hypothetical protein ABL994_23925 [Verrucomicrobiales bacterium]
MAAAVKAVDSVVEVGSLVHLALDLVLHPVVADLAVEEDSVARLVAAKAVDSEVEADLVAHRGVGIEEDLVLQAVVVPCSIPIVTVESTRMN